ncbi:hypothetical protein IAT38_004365 [Cryptococcus sp. DSM 104549]
MTLPAPIVAVTGLNGFIATHVAAHFLSQGWSVRGSVRTESTAATVKTLPIFKKAVEEGRLEVVILTDLAEGDFGPLLEGVEGVASVAAPLPGAKNGTWESYKKPTVSGAVNLLTAAKKVPTIKGVALMSSMGASLSLDPPEKLVGKVFTEDDWTPFDDESCKALDPEDFMTLVAWYWAAKKLAEQAALEFIAKEHPSFSVSTICPPMTYGPFSHIASAADLGATAKGNGALNEWATLVAGKDAEVIESYSNSYVDARDVAVAFYQSVVKQVSGRFMVSAGESGMQAYLDTARKVRPDLDAFIPLGEPGKPRPQGWSVDASKSVKELGFTYRSLEDSVADTLAVFEEIGVFKLPPGAWKEGHEGAAWTKE